MEVKPYKVIAYGIGAASIFDRVSGDRLGWVLGDYDRNWTAYLASTKGRLGTRRSRSDAASLVWDMSGRAA